MEKRIAIVIVAVIAAFFVGSFFLDRAQLEQTFQREVNEGISLMPTYETFATDYPRTPVEFQFKDATLRGYIYKADEPKGFIIFRHGISSQHSEYLALICAMVDRGWNVFAYDAIGCGESDGNNVIGMAQSPLDVAAAVNYVRETGLNNSLPIVLWGHSWGGYGVAAALDLVPDVRACVTMSGYNAPVEIICEWSEKTIGPIAILQRPTLWLNNMLTFGADANRTALDGINKTESPVLVIHGTNDTVVTYDGTSIIAQRNRITNPNVEYYEPDEPGRDGHNSFFYTKAANDYLAEKSAELDELEARYPSGVPDETTDAFMADYDVHRGNQADPTLISTIDEFLTKAIGGTIVKSAPTDQYGALQSVHYSDSGNSLGNYYAVDAERTSDGTTIVRVSDSKMHSDPADISEFRAPDDLLNQIDAIVDKAGMKTWGELPLSEFIAYDASTKSLNLTYANADPNEEFPLWLSTSFSYKLPEGGAEAVLAIRDLMLSYATEENLIRQYVEERR